MTLKKHGKFLLDFVVRYADGEMDRWEFDLDYSGYMIEHFGPFEVETPKLAVKFARTVDAAYSNYSWMQNDSFRLAISDAVDEFLGTSQISDIY